MFARIRPTATLPYPPAPDYRLNSPEGVMLKARAMDAIGGHNALQQTDDPSTRDVERKVISLTSRQPRQLDVLF
jgi:hypothetical protein